jgi:hypothetical protein
MTCPDPSLQLIALEEMTTLIKGGQFFPSSPTIEAAMTPQFMKNSIFVHLTFRWIMTFFTKELSSRLLTKIYQASETIWFGRPANSLRLHAIQKKVIAMSSASLKNSKRELAMIQDYCIGQIKSGFVTPGLIDVFTSLCTKTKDSRQFCEVTESWLAGPIGPGTLTIAESIAQHRQANGVDPSGQMRYFFGLFNCEVLGEKQNRGGGHANVISRYTGAYKRAIELLGHPKLRVFAPILAMFPEDVPVPSEIEAFFDANLEKIQRTFSLEAEHEW